MKYLGATNNGIMFDFKFEGNQKEKIQPVLDDFFMKREYKNTGSVQNKVTYEKGNRTMRILLGAFVTYHKVDFLYLEEEGNTLLRMLKASSGMSGGLIGMNQVKSEFNRIVSQLNEHFENAVS